MFRQAPAVIAVTQSPEHHVVTANPLFRQVVGAHRAGEGLPVRQALPDLESQGFFELLDGVYASGESFVGNELLARLARNADGVVEDGFFNFVHHPPREADGEVRGIMIHAVEVTDQVGARKVVELKAEELLRLTHALEQSNRELARMMEGELVVRSVVGEGSTFVLTLPRAGAPSSAGDADAPSSA